MKFASSVPRDANYVPVTNMGFHSVAPQTLDGSNTTVAESVFRVTGSVKVLALYGIVTTALGSNITAAHWRTYDQTATLPISAAAGTTLSSFAVGSLITRKSLVTVALTGDNASAAKVTDPVAATAPDVFMPFIVTQKTGSVTTDIQFVYTTTNTPTSGAIEHHLGWLPLTEGSSVAVVAA